MRQKLRIFISNFLLSSLNTLILPTSPNQCLPLVLLGQFHEQGILSFRLIVKSSIKNSKFLTHVNGVRVGGFFKFVKLFLEVCPRSVRSLTFWIRQCYWEPRQVDNWSGYTWQDNLLDKWQALWWFPLFIIPKERRRHLLSAHQL